MNRLCRPAITAVMIACCTLACTQTRNIDVQPQAGCRTLKDYRIVAERTTRTGKQALAADADARVVLLSLAGGGRIAETEPLGYEQQAPSDFRFSDSLPKDEALTLLRRISCGNQNWKLWVAQTIGFEEVAQRKPANMVNHVFVFRDGNQPNSKPLLAERFREISDFTVDDVNGDQKTEIVVQYSDEEAGTWMKMWQVDLSGNLRPIPLDNLKRDLTSVPGQVEIGLGDYRHGGELLFTEQRLQTSKGWHVTRRYYDWDGAKQRYELSEVVQSEEIITK